LGKALFDFGKFQSEQCRSGGEHEVEAGRHERLVSAINFPKATLRAIAMDRVSHRSTGGDHANPRRGVQYFGGATPPREKKSSAIDATTLLAHSTELVVAPQTLPGAEVHFKQP
jgi:hypothetical protein